MVGGLASGPSGLDLSEPTRTRLFLPRTAFQSISLTSSRLAGRSPCGLRSSLISHVVYVQVTYITDTTPASPTPHTQDHRMCRHTTHHRVLYFLIQPHVLVKRQRSSALLWVPYRETEPSTRSFNISNLSSLTYYILLKGSEIL